MTALTATRAHRIRELHVPCSGVRHASQRPDAGIIRIRGNCRTRKLQGAIKSPRSQRIFNFNNIIWINNQCFVQVNSSSSHFT